jgi:hypothetical protein
MEVSASDPFLGLLDVEVALCPAAAQVCDGSASVKKHDDGQAEHDGE